MAKIEACVGVGLYSIKLTYADGTSSPLFGHRHPNVESLVETDENTQLPSIVTAVNI